MTSDNDMEQRLQRLEKAVFGNSSSSNILSKKPVALSQLSRSTLLDNGQKKVAIIVGYNEVILNQPPMGFPQIKEEWMKAKFTNKCDPKLLERAIIDGLIRNPDNNKTYDLTQRGEDFLEQVLRTYEGMAQAERI